MKTLEVMRKARFDYRKVFKPRNFKDGNRKFEFDLEQVNNAYKLTLCGGEIIIFKINVSTVSEANRIVDYYYNSLVSAAGRELNHGF